jgi:hypothetical protein
MLEKGTFKFADQQISDEELGRLFSKPFLKE